MFPKNIFVQNAQTKILVQNAKPIFKQLANSFLFLYNHFPHFFSQIVKSSIVLDVNNFKNLVTKVIIWHPYLHKNVSVKGVHFVKIGKYIYMLGC